MDGRKRRRKGKSIIPAEFQCGKVTDKGKGVCKMARLAGRDACRHHVTENQVERRELAERKEQIRQLKVNETYSPPPQLPITNLDEYCVALVDTLHRTQQGKIPRQVASVEASLYDKLLKGMIAREKLSPGKIAQRTFSQEAMRKAIDAMDMDEVKRLTMNKDFRAMEEKIADEENPNRLTVTVLDTDSPELAAVKTAVNKKTNRISAEIEAVINGSLPVEEFGKDAESEDDE